MNAPNNLRAVDPGVCSGVALFFRGSLVECGAREIPQQLSVYYEVSPGRWEFTVGPVLDVLVVELPQIYPHMKGDPNDEITLARNMGKWEQANPSSKIVTPYPHTWKGTVPKVVTQYRVLQALGAHELEVLKPTAEERRLIEKGVEKKGSGITGYRHNVYDAVALGLWALGHYR